MVKDICLQQTMSMLPDFKPHILLTSIPDKDLQHIIHGLTLGLLLLSRRCGGCGAGAAGSQVCCITQRHGALKHVLGTLRAR